MGLSEWNSIGSRPSITKKKDEKRDMIFFEEEFYVK
jgi:hypothetical protein